MHAAQVPLYGTKHIFIGIEFRLVIFRLANDGIVFGLIYNSVALGQEEPFRLLLDCSSGLALRSAD